MKRRLLFLPGYACTAKIWKDVSTYFSADFDAVLVNWPGELTPHFDTIRHFSDWLQSDCKCDKEDLLVGHSLGGLVALDLMTRLSNKTVPVTLVESFLTTPSPFFQNLLMPTADPSLAAEITKMLQAQKQDYSNGLSDKLRDLDFTNEVLSASAPIRAVYGDRGSGNHDKVYAELGWSNTLQTRVDVKIISNACHFPMLENPAETIRTLRLILNDFISPEIP